MKTFNEKLYDLLIWTFGLGLFPTLAVCSLQWNDKNYFLYTCGFATIWAILAVISNYKDLMKIYNMNIGDDK